MILNSKKDSKLKIIWKQKWIRITTYILLSLVAIFLVFNKSITNYLVRSYQPIINRSTIQNANKSNGKNDYASVKKLTLAHIARARVNAKNIPIVGQICIPDDGINLPIAKGINNTNLAFAAGTFRNNMEMGKGNYALAGHNMSNLGPKVLFSPLYYRAKVGQKIYLTDMKNVYTYKITSKKFVSKYRVDLVKKTKKKQITLITCDATGANRLAVQGKYISSRKYQKTPQNVRKALSQKFNQ